MCGNERNATRCISNYGMTKVKRVNFRLQTRRALNRQKFLYGEIYEWLAIRAWLLRDVVIHGHRDRVVFARRFSHSSWDVLFKQEEHINSKYPSDKNRSVRCQKVEK
jgi:hypothetical protein